MFLHTRFFKGTIPNEIVAKFGIESASLTWSKFVFFLTNSNVQKHSKKFKIK